MLFSFFVEGVPKGQPRPRFARRTGHCYDPGTADEWKGQVEQAAAVVEGPLQGPLELTVEFYFPRPKKHFLRGRLRSDAPRLVESKPDIDNAVKAVMDALTDAGVWFDDSQVVRQIATKWYGEDQTGAKVTIQKL